MMEQCNNILKEIKSIQSSNTQPNTNANIHFTEILTKVINILKILNSDHETHTFTINNYKNNHLKNEENQNQFCNIIQHVLSISNDLFDGIDISILFDRLNLSFWIEYQTFIKNYSCHILMNITNMTNSKKSYKQELYQFIWLNNSLVDRLLNYCIDIEGSDEDFETNLENLLKIILFYIQKIYSNIIYCLLPLLHLPVASSISIPVSVTASDSDSDCISVSILLEYCYILILVCIGYVHTITTKTNTTTKYATHMLKLKSVVGNIYKHIDTMNNNTNTNNTNNTPTTPGIDIILLFRGYVGGVMSRIVNNGCDCNGSSGTNSTHDTNTPLPTNTISTDAPPTTGTTGTTGSLFKYVLNNFETPKLILTQVNNTNKTTTTTTTKVCFMNSSRLVSLFLKGVSCSTQFNMNHMMGISVGIRGDTNSDTNSDINTNIDTNNQVTMEVSNPTLTSTSTLNTKYTQYRQYIEYIEHCINTMVMSLCLDLWLYGDSSSSSGLDEVYAMTVAIHNCIDKYGDNCNPNPSHNNSPSPGHDPTGVATMLSDVMVSVLCLPT